MVYGWSTYGSFYRFHFKLVIPFNFKTAITFGTLMNAQFVPIRGIFLPFY